MSLPEPETLRANLRALPPTAWILFGGTFVNRFGTFVVPFLVLYLRSKGYSLAQSGLALSAYGAGNVVSAAVGGHLADRLGRRNAIAISMFSSAAAMLALSQARGLTAIVVLTAAAGCTAELYRPASSALLTDLTPAGQRVAAFAAYRLAINAGFAAGPVTAGFLAEHSFFVVFLADALTSIVFGVICLAALPAGVRTSRHEEERGEFGRALAADRRFQLFLIASLLGASVYFQSLSTLALHVTEHGFSKAVYGSLMSLNGVVIVCCELPLTSVTRRLPARPVIAAGAALMGIGFALTSVADTAAALALTVAVWTLGEIVNAPVASAYVADLAPVRVRGRYQGAWGMVWALAGVLAPIGGTALFAWNETVLWILCGVLGLVEGALVLVGPRA